MTLTRRDAMLTAAAAGAAAALPLPALAAADKVAAAIMEFTGGVTPAEGDVEIGAPEIAENGNTVPIEIGMEGAAAILVLADGNPSPGVATFHFSEMAEPRASTRIRLATTQNVVAVAKLRDGSFVQAARAVKVTIGGCGG